MKEECWICGEMFSKKYSIWDGCDKCVMDNCQENIECIFEMINDLEDEYFLNYSIPALKDYIWIIGVILGIYKDN